ncbi:MAG: hypothetical protein ACE5GV_09145, partial [Candidatus Scalindua sp.]
KLFFIILFMFAVLVQPTFAEESEIDLKISDLESRYAEVETALKDFQDEADRLENIGYGGPVLRKDLKILADNIVHLKKELASLDNELDLLAEGGLLNIPKFDISATINTQD